MATDFIDTRTLIILAIGIDIGFLLARGLPAKAPADPFEIDRLIGQLSDQQRKEVVSALRNGNKIEAIRAFRAATNSGLKEAKDAVERMHS